MYLKNHTNSIAKSMYRSFVVNIWRIIVEQVAKIVMATNSTIIFCSSKDFLTIYFTI